MTIAQILQVLNIENANERNQQALQLLIPELPEEIPDHENHNKPYQHPIREFTKLCDDHSLLPGDEIIALAAHFAPDMKLSRLIDLLDIFIATRLQPTLYHDSNHNTHSSTVDLARTIANFADTPIRYIIKTWTAIRDALNPQLQQATTPIRPPSPLKFSSW